MRLINRFAYILTYLLAKLLTQNVWCCGLCRRGLWSAVLWSSVMSRWSHPHTGVLQHSRGHSPRHRQFIDVYHRYDPSSQCCVLGIICPWPLSSSPRPWCATAALTLSTGLTYFHGRVIHILPVNEEVDLGLGTWLSLRTRLWCFQGASEWPQNKFIHVTHKSNLKSDKARRGLQEIYCVCRWAALSPVVCHYSPGLL